MGSRYVCTWVTHGDTTRVQAEYPGLQLLAHWLHLLRLENGVGSGLQYLDLYPNPKGPCTQTVHNFGLEAVPI